MKKVALFGLLLTGKQPGGRATLEVLAHQNNKLHKCRLLSMGDHSSPLFVCPVSGTGGAGDGEGGTAQPSWLPGPLSCVPTLAV